MRNDAVDYAINGWVVVFFFPPRGLSLRLAVVLERSACLDPAVAHVTLFPRGSVDSPKRH
jgi:hypothetical protein